MIRDGGMQTFIKTVNYQHLMPTRYTLEADLKGVVTAEAQENPTKKKESRKVRIYSVLDGV